MTKKLEKIKVTKVTEFIDRQESNRIRTLHGDFENQSDQKPSDNNLLSPPTN